MHSLGAAVTIPVLSVTELNQRLRASLESDFGEVWVGGEISNFRVPPSGHFYFCLKDRRSQVAAVMFRSANQVLRFRPHDGLEVIVRGRVSLYEVRGDLQLYVDAMEPRGHGALQLALEQLKHRLAAEGLFAEERKRPLPFWPRAVGIATALTGAAIHDMLTTIRGRMPQARVIVRPVRVQGEGAWFDVVAALAELNTFPDIEVIIIGRGGGSLEDLWAFNDERVVRAVAASRAPVVSAVGHEADVTLTDLVADRRAATPTAAGALVVPACDALRLQLGRTGARLATVMRRRARRERERLTALAARVRHPQQLLRTQRLHLDELAERSQRALEAQQRLARARLTGLAARLEALSPLAVLQRGYAIAQRAADGAVVRAADEVVPGDELRLVLARGRLRVRVEKPDDG